MSEQRTDCLKSSGKSTSFNWIIAWAKPKGLIWFSTTLRYSCLKLGVWTLAWWRATILFARVTHEFIVTWWPVSNRNRSRIPVDTGWNSSFFDGNKPKQACLWLFKGWTTATDPSEMKYTVSVLSFFEGWTIAREVFPIPGTFSVFWNKAYVALILINAFNSPGVINAGSDDILTKASPPLKMASL